MSLVTEEAVRALAGFKGMEAPVVSVYLDVDGRRYPRHQDYELALERLLRPARTRALPSVLQDLGRIETQVRGGFARAQTRGVAFFACSAHGFWEVLELSVPVRNQLVINHTPHVRQLEALLHASERFGVLVVDRQRARLFVFDQGELIDQTERFDRLPRHDDDHGDWDRDHVRDHATALAHAHIRRAAQAAFAAFQHRSFDHLILVAPSELSHEVERELHTYLRTRIAARLSLSASATLAEIRRAALEVEAGVERERQAALVARLLDRAASGGGAVVGLGPVLIALVERRVETLVVSDGFVAPGWRCWGCDHAAMLGPGCSTCGGAMTRVDDVVEEAVEVALGQASRVVTCLDNADLDVHGRIGALLRF